MIPCPATPDDIRNLSKNRIKVWKDKQYSINDKSIDIAVKKSKEVKREKNYLETTQVCKNDLR